MSCDPRRTRLKKERTAGNGGRRTMDKWLRNPKVVGVISLTLAILLWGVVHLDEQQTKPVPLTTNTSTSEEIENVSIEMFGLIEDKHVLLSVEPKNVRIRVRGSSSAIKKIN